MAVEYRGCRKLVYAEVTEDTAEGITFGEVKTLAPVQEISKTVETSNETKYYDNLPAIIINSEGTDTVTFTIAAPSDEVRADIEGRVYDSVKKQFIEAPRKNKYFAVGYIYGETGEGDEEYCVWRYKGTFNIPDQTNATKNDGTDANNLSLEYSGIYPTHEFANGGGTGVKASAKSMRMKIGDVTESKFFSQVTTPDTALT